MCRSVASSARNTSPWPLQVMRLQALAGHRALEHRPQTAGALVVELDVALVGDHRPAPGEASGPSVTLTSLEFCLTQRWPGLSTWWKAVSADSAPGRAPATGVGCGAAGPGGCGACDGWRAAATAQWAAATAQWVRTAAGVARPARAGVALADPTALRAATAPAAASRPVPRRRAAEGADQVGESAGEALPHGAEAPDVLPVQVGDHHGPLGAEVGAGEGVPDAPPCRRRRCGRGRTGCCAAVPRHRRSRHRTTAGATEVGDLVEQHAERVGVTRLRAELAHRTLGRLRLVEEDEVPVVGELVAASRPKQEMSHSCPARRTGPRRRGRCPRSTPTTGSSAPW